MARTGRPQLDIDWEQFEKLCEIQCTAEEVAFWFRCSVDTIERAVKRKYKTTYADIMRQKGVRGRIAIRRELFQLGLKGNLGALIWLSKNHLGMSDKVETTNETNLKTAHPIVFTTKWGALPNGSDE